MKKWLIGFGLLMLATISHAEVTITHAWIRSTAPGQSVAAGYLKFVSDKDVTLISLSSPVANSVAVHEMIMNGDVMKMREVKQLNLKAGKAVELTPDSYHLMFNEIKHPIKDGEAVPVDFVFSGKDNIHSTVSIKIIARSSDPNQSH
ncbi:copper chaperone PCu(A)C [Methyloradius palustris]|uniref:Copper chaperone PCu(A)C n=1 Tax=Methyloradius palustris TaxID=2778876 RepID=A0A8D5FZB6_9PROT|nr:copper chaperone PCu(A)C [Methyloradius palustris]BCM24500.1 hypothetical protein ZMTM_07590 [Methyloradius palustris]